MWSNVTDKKMSARIFHCQPGDKHAEK